MSILRRLQGPLAEATYCSWCGDPLTITTEPDGFDRYTGKPLTKRRGDCPRIVAHGPFPKGHPSLPSPLSRGQL